MKALREMLKDPDLLREDCLIGGVWRKTDATFDVINPANGEVVAKVASAGAEETKEAIQIADQAFPAFSRQMAIERARMLEEWERLCKQHIDDLAIILTVEEGKTLSESRAEISKGITYIPWFAAQCQRASGSVIVPSRKGTQPLTRYTALGVAAIITPWNFPFSMLPRKLAPAFATGCPVIVKPSSRTPLSALALMELAVRAGFPPATLNCLCGSASLISDEICRSKLVRKVSFTGSTRVGIELAEACAPTLKRVSLELGGNAPFMVFGDADVTKAVDLAIGCKFRNAGQACVAGNRFLIQASVEKEFVAGLTRKVTALKLGNGLEAGVDMGPLIDARAVARVDSLVQDAIAHGAVCVCGGKVSPLGPNFYEPTILTGVTTEMRIFREEIFGPVVPIITFQSDDDAIELANYTHYGLAAYACLDRQSLIWKLYARLQFGILGINEVSLSSAEVPFGGVKDSGLGREGGAEALLEYMEEKSMVLGNL